MVISFKEVSRQQGNTRKLINDFLDNYYNKKGSLDDSLSYLFVKNKEMKKNMLQLYGQDFNINRILLDGIKVIGQYSFTELNDKYFRGKRVDTIFIDDCYHHVNITPEGFARLSFADTKPFNIYGVGTK